MSYMLSKSSLLNMPGYFIPRRPRPGTRPSGRQEAADSEARSQSGPSCYGPWGLGQDSELPKDTCPFHVVATDGIRGRGHGSAVRHHSKIHSAVTQAGRGGGNGKPETIGK